MKKQKTLLIVVLILAIVMVVLYLAIGLISGKEKKIGDDVKEVTMLTDIEDVTYVQYKNVEGTVTLEKKDGVWKSAENSELELVDANVDEKVAELGKIEGELVADAVKADYGLEEPVYALTIKNAETEEKLVIGVSEDGICYAMEDGKDDIYEIDEDVIIILEMGVEDFSDRGGIMSSHFDTSEEDTMIDEGFEEYGEDMEEEIIIDDSTIAEDIAPEDTSEEEPTTEE